MNLRLLYLLYISLNKVNGKDLGISTELIKFLMDNIHKFRTILQMKESYVYEIPAVKKVAGPKKEVEEQK